MGFCGQSGSHRPANRGFQLFFFSLFGFLDALFVVIHDLQSQIELKKLEHAYQVYYQKNKQINTNLTI